MKYIKRKSGMEILDNFYHVFSYRNEARIRDGVANINNYIGNILLSKKFYVMISANEAASQTIKQWRREC